MVETNYERLQINSQHNLAIREKENSKTAGRQRAWQKGDSFRHKEDEYSPVKMSTGGLTWDKILLEKMELKGISKSC